MPEITAEQIQGYANTANTSVSLIKDIASMFKRDKPTVDPVASKNEFMAYVTQKLAEKKAADDAARLAKGSNNTALYVIGGVLGLGLITLIVVLAVKK